MNHDDNGNLMNSEGESCHLSNEESNEDMEEVNVDDFNPRKARI